jgi:hypothetical protein
MPKKGYKLSKQHRLKISRGTKLAYKKDKTLKDRTKHFGKDNGRYTHGKCCIGYQNYCPDCGKKIARDATRCNRCNGIKNPTFKGKKHSIESKKLIGIKSKAKFTLVYKKRQRQMFEDMGFWIPLDKLDKYLLYSRQSDWLNPKFSKRGYVRDHRYSRFSGFKEGVPPIILRHPVNCEIITRSENISKGSKNSITLNKLIKLIKNYSGEYVEQTKCLKAIDNYLEGNRQLGVIYG